MSIQKYPDDWQEGNTTTSKRATRAVTVVLAVCVVVVIAVIIRLSGAVSSPATSQALKPQHAQNAAAGELQPVEMRTTPTIVVVVFENVTTEPLSQTPTVLPSATAEPTDAPTQMPETIPTPELSARPGATDVTPTLVSAGSVTSLAGGSINIRSGPGLNYGVVAYMQPNQQAQVVAQSSDGKWWRVDLNGKLGWLRKDTVVFRGDKSTVPVAAFNAPTPTAGPGR